MSPSTPLRLKAESRAERGKRVRRLRVLGKVPAVLYGHRADSEALALDGREFDKVFARAGRTQLVDLVVDGGRARKVLVREVQTHPRRLGPIHVDLYRVDLKEKLHAEVPIVLVGESPAVKMGDGDAIQGIHLLRVECLPQEIPEMVEADISGLTEADAVLRVSELKLGSGVTVLNDPEDVVVKIAPRREMALEEAAEEAPEEAAEVVAEAPEAAAEASGGEAGQGG